MNEINEKPKYLKLEKIIQFIEEVSNIDLQQQTEILQLNRRVFFEISTDRDNKVRKNSRLYIKKYCNRALFVI